ncbi:TrbL/VirB6 family protein [Rickettsia endosymbiont of Cardiosporidium cionae]|uniref:type IV secretion system protein n=1 Tax=Rickettsia endosymbiont of Cardiosporidium cionae TaxID=2777155 RepID=UPI0018945FAA|nr:type IV secretion system protein [Rickettsia endosymbiont of Cardiosporidium cionae]
MFKVIRYNKIYFILFIIIFVITDFTILGSAENIDSPTNIFTNNQTVSSPATLTVPGYGVVDNKVISLAVSNANWIDSTLHVNAGNNVKIKLDKNQLPSEDISQVRNNPEPDETYYVLFRIDPRFAKPQVVRSQKNISYEEFAGNLLALEKQDIDTINPSAFLPVSNQVPLTKGDTLVITLKDNLPIEPSENYVAKPNFRNILKSGIIYYNKLFIPGRAKDSGKHCHHKITYEDLSSIYKHCTSCNSISDSRNDNELATLTNNISDSACYNCLGIDIDNWADHNTKMKFVVDQYYDRKVEDFYDPSVTNAYQYQCVARNSGGTIDLAWEFIPPFAIPIPTTFWVPDVYGSYSEDLYSFPVTPPKKSWKNIAGEILTAFNRYRGTNTGYTYYIASDTTFSKYKDMFNWTVSQTWESCRDNQHSCKIWNYINAHVLWSFLQAEYTGSQNWTISNWDWLIENWSIVRKLFPNLFRVVHPDTLKFDTALGSIIGHKITNRLLGGQVINIAQCRYVRKWHIDYNKFNVADNEELVLKHVLHENNSVSSNSEKLDHAGDNVITVNQKFNIEGPCNVCNRGIITPDEINNSYCSNVCTASNTGKDMADLGDDALCFRCLNIESFPRKTSKTNKSIAAIHNSRNRVTGYITLPDHCPEIIPDGIIGTDIGYNILVGNPITTKPENSSYNQIVIPNTRNIPECTNRSSGLCINKYGQGMKIILGGDVIKDSNEKFPINHWNGSNIGAFFHYNKIDSDKTLIFDLDNSRPISGMISAEDYFQLFADWNLAGQNINFFDERLRLNQVDHVKFLHFGGYIMKLDIYHKIVNNDYQVSYSISDTPPDDDVVGTILTADQNTINATTSGNIWLKVVNAEDNGNIAGNIVVNLSNYTASSFFQDMIYPIIQSLIQQLSSVTNIMYHYIIGNHNVKNIVHTTLILYITIYGLLFLMGRVEISVEDLAIRVMKIAIIITLVSDASWDFFNNYLFRIFTESINQLIINIVNSDQLVDSSNPFSWIDLILSKYLNPYVLELLIYQLFSIMFFTTIMLIISMYRILVLVLRVIVNYTLSFLFLSVLIVLFPLFAVFMLFEHTQIMLSNWFGVMFAIMLNAIILMLFLLFLEQHISVFLYQAVSSQQLSINPLELNVAGIAILHEQYIQYQPIVTTPSTIQEFINANMLYINYIDIMLSTFIIYIFGKISSVLPEYTRSIVTVITSMQNAAVVDDVISKVSR